MKKLWITRAIVLLTAILISVLLVACKKEDGNEIRYSDDLEGLLEEIYACGGYSDMLMGMIHAPANTENMYYTHLMTIEITEENEMGFLGTNEIPYERAIASEPSMSPTLYSLCLLKVKEGEDVEKVAKQVKENADPRKWVCTGLSDNDVYVDYVGDVVILVMSAQDGEALVESFKIVINGICLSNMDLIHEFSGDSNP